MDNTNKCGIILGGVDLKLRKHVLKNNVVLEVTIPKKYAQGLGWGEGQDLALCPNFEKGTLTLIPIRM